MAERFFIINNAVWHFLFKVYGQLSDHVGFLIFTICIIWGILFSVLKQKFIKRKSILMEISNVIPVTSVYYMLRQLPLIHPRLRLMLSTTASVILSSDTYKNAFFQQTGTAAEEASTIIYTLYYSPYKDLQLWNNTEPAMLYEKLASAFYKTRYFFGYLDFKTSGLYIFLISLMIVFFIYEFVKNKGAYKMIFIFNLLFCFSLLFTKNGCVLAFLILIFTEQLLNLFFQFSKKKIQIQENTD